MKNFWPNRSKAKGFSIQNLARKYRLKGIRSMTSSDDISSLTIDDRNLLSMKEEGEKIPNVSLNIKRIHWANRDFSEYKEAA